jgi:N-acetylglucosamine-6-phosphate deacetylase
MRAFLGAAIFDGTTWHRNHALLVQAGEVKALVPADQVPPAADIQRLEGGLLAPGFVDLQVNGGGGVLFNDTPTPEGIAAIARAHARHGTTALLPTLITDTPEVTARAIAAARATPGCLGLHLEGPHIALSRKGAHDAALIRPMSDADLMQLTTSGIPHLMVTLAPEVVPAATIAALSAAGIVVSLGHSDARYDQAVQAGARCVTHLFNAMSQFAGREPGLVGAALDRTDLFCGLIADGVHVHPTALRLAWAAKRDRLFLVSDAMPTMGMAGDRFDLNGRRVTRRDGRLTLGDGTLAGADPPLIYGVRVMVRQAAVPLDDALRMASLRPAQALGVASRHGHLRPGARADMVHLDEALDVLGCWIGGVPA